jgi:hypothetical protein
MLENWWHKKEAPLFTGFHFGFAKGSGGPVPKTITASGGTESTVTGSDGLNYKLHSGIGPTTPFVVNSYTGDAHFFVELSTGGGGGGGNVGGGAGGGGGGGGGGLIQAKINAEQGSLIAQTYTCSIGNGGNEGGPGGGGGSGQRGQGGNSANQSTFSSPTEAIVTMNGAGGGGGGVYQGGGGGGGNSGGSQSPRVHATVTETNFYPTPGGSGSGWSPGNPGPGGKSYGPQVPTGYVLENTFATGNPTGGDLEPTNGRGGSGFGPGGGHGNNAEGGNSGFCRVFYPVDFV